MQSQHSSNSNNWVIRPADPEGRDDFAIGEILVRAYVEGYARKLPFVVVSEQRKVDLRNVAEKREDGCVLVAIADHRTVIGSVTLYPPGAARSESWLPMAADLRFLGVDPQYKGKGVAEALMDQAEEKARKWGCNSVCLHVRRGAVGIARLYLKRGYQREPSGDLEKPEIFLEAFRLDLGVESD